MSDYADIAAQARRSERKVLAIETTVADLRFENANVTAALEDAKRALHDTQAHGDSVGNRDHVAAVIQRAWRKLRGIDVLGKRLLREGNAVNVFQTADYDADELMQATWPANVKWHAFQRAPAFIQNEPTTNMKFETQRLILARLAGDRGDAVSTSEEMEQRASMVLTACKVVAGVMGKTHVLSTGARVLEVDGAGAYEASGASAKLMTALDMEASCKGYAAIILLSTPAGVSFYSCFGFERMQSWSLDPADAARHALHYLSTNAIYRHAPMLKLLLCEQKVPQLRLDVKLVIAPLAATTRLRAAVFARVHARSAARHKAEAPSHFQQALLLAELLGPVPHAWPGASLQLVPISTLSLFTATGASLTNIRWP